MSDRIWIALMQFNEKRKLPLNVLEEIYEDIDDELMFLIQFKHYPIAKDCDCYDDYKEKIIKAISNGTYFLLKKYL